MKYGNAKMYQFGCEPQKILKIENSVTQAIMSIISTKAMYISNLRIQKILLKIFKFIIPIFYRLPVERISAFSIFRN